MLEGFAVTEGGPLHEDNEDRHLVAEAIGLYMVADGMGGQNSGCLAARLTVEVVERFVRRSERMDEITWPFGIDREVSPEANRLLTAVKIANRRVWKKADSDLEHVGMGSTVLAALCREDGAGLTICWAGDSRAYRWRDDELELLTQDDSFAAAALAEGLLSADKVRSHPMRNLITKAVGASQTLEPNLRDEVTVRPDDLFLLCSDGLHKSLGPDEIAAILAGPSGDPAAAAEELVAEARGRGSDDDITALVLRPAPAAPD